MALTVLRRKSDNRPAAPYSIDSTNSSADSVQMMDSKHDVLEKCLVMPCLDRPFLPGMLYDARTHTIFPQVLSTDQLSQEIKRTEYPSQTHELLMDESTSDKMFHLDIGASLSLSLLSGLVSISGSARYTQDHKTSQKQARVTLRYKSTHFCDDFPLANLKSLPKSFPAVFSQSKSGDSSPTHIVFRVVYGSQVVMMFDAMSMDNENHMEIQGKLQAQLNLGIPEVSGSAEVDANISKDDKEFCKRIAMKFYGDGINLESNPTSYEQAMTTYGNLPKLCGKQGLGAPQTVWLYPLSCLQPSAPKLVQELSSSTALIVHKVFDDIQDLMVRSTDALKSIQVKGLHDQLVRFQEWLGNKKIELTSQIAVLLPKEHKGEHCIEDFIKKFCKTFRYDILSTWLKQKEEEITILLSFINVILINDKKNKVKSAFCDGELVSHYARFASLIYIQLNVDRKDPFLESLLDPKAGEVTQAEASPWFRNLQKVKDMKNAVDTFRFMSCYLIDARFGLAVTTNSTIGAEENSDSGAIASIKEFGVDKEPLKQCKDGEWLFIVTSLSSNDSNPLVLTVKDGCTDPDTPVVIETKSESSDRQMWKERRVHNFNFFYFVSKLGDNIKLGFKNNRAVISSEGAILWDIPSTSPTPTFAHNPNTVLEVFQSDATPGTPVVYHMLKDGEKPNQPNQQWYALGRN